ncbi:hypothetical protein LSS_08409 [Leptospira santarosai serovar Shermani str. LT 821]|uniref:Uncharacterized protein n=1 Tax=Leptospira santarosai serovar Shermani str. LT 821 TaxID=758847 RepID=K8Y0T3_9LEPT|nr:hypothetical protein LSS_08409 [Leptospira santarosai serovar Shermani str. LT 821]
MGRKTIILRKGRTRVVSSSDKVRSRPTEGALAFLRESFLILENRL